MRGLEFARRNQNEFSFGFETKRAATTSHLSEIKELAALMNQLRGDLRAATPRDADAHERQQFFQRD